MTVLLVVVWIQSARWQFGWQGPSGNDAVLYRGTLFISWGETWGPAGFPHGWRAYPEKDPLIWAFRFEPNSRAANLGWNVWIPMWAPTALCVLITALAFRLDTLARRRARMNLCAKCHYDRTGLAGDAVCPECGVPVGPVAKDQ